MKIFGYLETTRDFLMPAVQLSLLAGWCYSPSAC